MRFTRMLLMVASAAALTAVLAPVASAQTLEVLDAEEFEHCAAVSLSTTDVNGGCLIHTTSVGNVELRKHVFGIEAHITTCATEFHGRISEDASGYLLEQALSGGGCVRQACKPSSEATPWAFAASEGSTVEGTEYMTTSFCVEPNGGGTDETCEIDIPFQQGAPPNRTIELGHASELSSHGITGFRCELVGHWASEVGGTHDGDPEQKVSVNHLDGDDAQELWEDSSYTDLAPAANDNDGFGAQFVLESSEVVIDTGSVDVTCTDSELGMTVLENSAAEGVAASVEAALLTECTDAEGDVTVYADTSTPWTATLIDTDTFELTGIALQVDSPGYSMVCEFDDHASVFDMTWVDATPTGSGFGYDDELMDLESGGSCADGEITADYDIGLESGPNGNLWLQ
jgi:hypothetical protein